MQWFRFYHEVLDDPKVQKLDPVTFKHWVNMLCLAARNGGKLPPRADLAFALRIDEIALETVLERLLNATLIDVRTGGVNGSHIAMHGWEKRQYKSDSSTARVKRFRKQDKAVTETPPDTEADTDIPLAKANGAEVDSDKAFWDAAKAYLGKSKAGLIGKWASQYGQGETAKAITAAQIARAVDPPAYIEKVLRKTVSDEWEFTGPC